MQGIQFNVYHNFIDERFLSRPIVTQLYKQRRIRTAQIKNKKRKKRKKERNVTTIPNFCSIIVLFNCSFICRIRKVFTRNNSNKSSSLEERRKRTHFARPSSPTVIQRSPAFDITSKSMRSLPTSCGSTSVLFKLPWSVSGTH